LKSLLNFEEESLKGSGEKGQGSEGGESIWWVFEPRMARILRMEMLMNEWGATGD
jgi:hypothetical protein